MSLDLFFTIPRVLSQAIHRIEKDVLGRLVVFVGAAVLVATVGCDEQPMNSLPPASKPQPPPPPVLILKDSANQPPSPVLDDRTTEDPRGEVHAGSMPEGQTETMSQSGLASNGGGSPPVAPSRGVPPTGTQPQMCVKLSAGVVLPQSLPGGTAMGLSVDYVLVGSLPTSSGPIVWVIKSAKGGSAEVVVRLAERGNLMTFVTSMRPEHGPFQSYLAIVLTDGGRLPISPKIEMKSP